MVKARTLFYYLKKRFILQIYYMKYFHYIKLTRCEITTYFLNQQSKLGIFDLE